MDMNKLMADAQKEFGEKVRVGSDVAKIEAIPTGVPSLDVAIGIGGWPKGGLSMIFGPESVGKSALAYTSVAEFQRTNPYQAAAIIDLEGSFDPEWMTRLGADPETIIIMSPISAEEASKNLVWAASKEEIGMIVFDSIGAMAGERELEEDGKKQAYGQSGIITDMIKKAQPRIYASKKVCILINQVRDTANMRNLPMLHPPGGHALRHACALIIQMRPGQEKFKYKYSNGEAEVGYRPVLTINKSKVGPPKKNAEYNFYFQETPEHFVGIDVEDSLIGAAINVGVVDRQVAMYEFDGQKIRGREAFVSWIKEDRSRFEKLRDEFYKFFERGEDAEVHE